MRSGPPTAKSGSVARFRPTRSRVRFPATPTGRARLRRCKTPPAPLVQNGIERLVAQLDGGLVNHAPNLVRTSAAPESPGAKSHPDSVTHQRTLSPPTAHVTGDG